MEQQSFFSYMNASLTPYHAAKEHHRFLIEQGFQLLSENNAWQLTPGGRYLIDSNDGTTCAFVLPNETPTGIRIIGTHNDSPALRLKPSPTLVREELSLLNIEVYGGPLLGTWFDRPLAIAGRVYSRGDNWAVPQSHLVCLPEQVAIPSLAAHMKRGDDAINPQKELLALWGKADAPRLETRLAEHLGIDESDLLATELYLVSAEKASVFGYDDDLYAASRIDNLANAYAACHALGDSQPQHDIALFISYQHEEIGSHTRQGASAPHLSRLLTRIAQALHAELDALLAQSIILSCDQAHAAHPNYSEKADPVLRPRLGRGPVLKLAANHSYATTPRGEAMIRALCADENLPIQCFTNRADMRGGSTIGPLAETATGIEAIDLGSPMLAMHSIRECASLSDQAAMQQLMTAFYNK